MQNFNFGIFCIYYVFEWLSNGFQKTCNVSLESCRLLFGTYNALFDFQNMTAPGQNLLSLYEKEQHEHSVKYLLLFSTEKKKKKHTNLEQYEGK